MSMLNVKHFGGFFDIYSNKWGVFRSTCDDVSYHFNAGVYILLGEIDSGAWAFTSALCSKKKNNACILDNETKFYFNETEVTLDDIRKISCDLDGPFNYTGSFNKSVEKRVEDSITKYKLPYTVKDIQKMFHLTDERYKRALKYAGNERFRCNAALGFVQRKKIFCFPWLSEKAERYYEGSIYLISDILAKLGCIVLMPCSELIEKSDDRYNYIRFPMNKELM